MENPPVSSRDVGIRLKDQPAQPLLSTKLFTPPLRFHLVSRRRLLSRLQQAPQYPLTLICAPAGYGKTTLLAEWLAEDPAVSGLARVGWLSLDEEDNDPTRFLAYVIAAIEKVCPEVTRDAQADLRSPQPPPIQTILVVLINSLQNLIHPLWLVLDDYHFITNREVHTSLTFLLEHLPALFHLVIATRSDPPLPLHRLRASNRLLELRSDDLRFTTEETTTFINQVMALCLSPDDILTLENRTEGWIAGLQMAALSMQGLEDRAAFVRDFGGSHRFVLEYLIEEILERQPEQIQTFMLHTAVLDRLCASLCDAVVMEPGSSRESLDYLERANLFINPLDGVRCWYRYHHLFADLLRARLIQSHPELLPALHTRASVWYEQEGWPEEAIKHALAAHDLERAAGLVERYTAAIMHRGEMTALLKFIRALPEELMNRNPGLCIAHAWALIFTGQFDLLAARLEQAEAQLEPGDSSPAAREMRGNIAIIRGLVADFCGDIPTAARQARIADELLSPENRLARGVIYYVLGDEYSRTGDHALAEQTFEKILDIGEGLDNLWITEIALFKLSLVKRLRGKLRDAWDYYQTAYQKAAQKQSLQIGFMGTMYICMSEIQFEWNELASAEQLVSQALRLTEQWPNPLDLGSAYISRTRIAIAQGDLAAAEQMIKKLEELRRNVLAMSAIQGHLDDCQVRIWLAKRERSSLQGWVSEQNIDAEGEISTSESDPTGKRIRLTQARALIALGAQGAEKAVHRLTPVAEAIRSTGQAGMLIETLALLAHAQHAGGDRASARKTVCECVTLAAGEGYARVFLDEGEAMREMLEGLRAEIERDPTDDSQALLPDISRILAAFPPAPRPAARTEEPASPGLDLVEPLSARELEVLALICQGASNQEIAEQLVVTLNTVKKHNNRIFGKLGVTSRIQAVLLAKHLGLFSESSPVLEE